MHAESRQKRHQRKIRTVVSWLGGVGDKEESVGEAEYGRWQYGRCCELCQYILIQYYCLWLEVVFTSSLGTVVPLVV